MLPLNTATPTAIGSAVAQGARRILCIPPDAPLPSRILVHASDAARRAELLALVSSVMRHLPIETTAVTLQRSEANRNEFIDAQRTLHDTRADLRSAHGLDLRADRFVGELSDWLQHIVAQTDAVLVVLGLHAKQPELSARLAGELAALFSGNTHSAVLFAVTNSQV